MKKIVIITGANSGLGFQLAQQLCGEDCYVIGFVHSYNNGAQFKQILLDITDYNQVMITVQRIVETYGKIDILINNAGVYLDDPRKKKISIINLSLQDLINTLSVNYFSVFNLINLVCNLQRKNGYGRIVNISSGMGRFLEIEKFSYAYRVSKLLLNTLTIVYGKIFDEYEEDVAIMSVCPGWIKTKMGTENAPLDVTVAVEYIVSLLFKEKKQVNGKFLRYGKELSWIEKVEETTVCD